MPQIGLKIGKRRVLIQFNDLNDDGAIQYRGPNSDVQNELTIDRDIMVLANPEIAKLPNLGRGISRCWRFSGSTLDRRRFAIGHLHRGLHTIY